MSLIHLFRRCNQKCVFCSYPADKADRKAPGLRDWLKEISEMEPGLVQLSGGEPLLADPGDLLKIISFCGRTGRPVELQTNGTPVRDMAQDRLETLVEALRSAKGYFNINFPAHNAALDLKITGTAGAFAARRTAVLRLLKLGAKVRLTHVISELNYKKTAAFAAFAAANFNSCAGAVSGQMAGKTAKGLAWLQFSYIKGIGRAEGSRFIPEYSKAAPYLLKALDLCAAKGLRCDVDHIPPCFLGAHYTLNVDMAKMRSGAGGPHLAEKEKVPECEGCRFFSCCPGPRKDYIAAHPALFPKGRGPAGLRCGAGRKERR